MSLPSDPKLRKEVPLVAGLVDYFPDALAYVAGVSRAGGVQHNPGKPLFWDRSKSGDEADALLRHLFDYGRIDTDGIRHSGKVAWRALALLQKELEADGVATLPRGAIAVYPEPAGRPGKVMSVAKVTGDDDFGFMYGRFEEENEKQSDRPVASGSGPSY